MRRRSIPAALVVAIIIAGPASSRAQTRVAPFVATAGDGSLPEVEPRTLYDTIADALALVPSLNTTWPAVDGASAIAECGVDAKCLGRVVVRTGATLGLAIALYASAGKQLITLRLLDSSGRAKEPIVVEADPADLHGAITRAIHAAAGRARYEVFGRVHLGVEPNDAVIRDASGVVVGRSLVLRPGRHVFRASRDGFVDGSSTVEVVAGRTTNLELKLIADEPSLFAQPTTWMVIGGIAVVAAAVTVVAIAVRPEGALTVCHGPEGSSCP